MRLAGVSWLGLCLLFVLIVAGTVGAAGPAVLDSGQLGSVRTPQNTSGYLVPGGNRTTTSDYVYTDVDVGVAVSQNVASIRATHERLTIERAVTDAANRSEAVRALRAEMTTLENRTASLERAYRRARSAYQQGSISTRELARTLARIDVRAAAVEEIRSQVEALATSLEPVPHRTVTRSQNLEAVLATLGGPATGRLEARYSGTRSAGETYVSVVGSDGLIVATTSSGDLIREALDASERQLGGPDTFGNTDEPAISVALRRAAQIYNWSFEHGQAVPPIRGYGNTTVYRVTVDHVRGRLSTYLDGSTGNVFYEVQRLQAPALPITDSVTATGNGLRITVNETVPTGPMEVTVAREATSMPVDARVTIAGSFVGQTGDDGSLWLVQPLDETTLTARTGGNTTVATTVG